MEYEVLSCRCLKTFKVIGIRLLHILQRGYYQCLVLLPVLAILGEMCTTDDVTLTEYGISVTVYYSWAFLDTAHP